MVLLRLAWRQVRNNPRFAALFIANLAVGLVGFVALDAFKRSVESSVAVESRNLLGADVALSNIDPFTDTQLAVLRQAAGDDATINAEVELFSMVAGPRRARLVELHAVDERFPLVGTFDVAGIAAPGTALNAEPVVIVDPELIGQLGVEVGGIVQLGGQDFRLVGVVDRSSARSRRGFSLAPRLFLGVRFLAETGLASAGSRVSHRSMVLLNDSTQSESLAEALRASFAGGSIQVQSHAQAGQQLGSALTTMSDYLGLVALVALFLGTLGVAYLFRGYIGERVGELAILMAVGATLRRAQRLLALQMIILGLAAASVAWLGSRLVLPLIPRFFGDFFPGEVVVQVPLSSLAIAIVVALLGAGALTWPLLRRLSNLRPADLFLEQGMPSFELGLTGVITYLPAVCLFWALSIWQSRSVLTGSLFIAVVATTAIAGAIASWLGLRLINRLHPRWLALRLALRQLRRSETATVTSFVAISVAALLATLVPQVRSSLEARIERPEDAAMPALFLFDIQEEQIDALETFLAERDLTLLQRSPLIRARMAAINDTPVDRNEASDEMETREEEMSRRFRTRAYNLSYREGLARSEKLTAGRLARAHHVDGQPAEITLEERFAERIGVGLGDILTFDVQGISIDGKVVGLRSVEWASFEPNFFVQFQPQVLEPAPKVFLGGIAGIDAVQEEALQADLVERFPNISVIDVSHAVELIGGVLDQIAWAMAFIAGISLFAGLVLIFAIARHQARIRRREIGLMKVVGASFDDVRRIIDIEFFTIAFFAALLGVAACLVASALLSVVLFKADWRPDWLAAGATVLCVTTATMAVARLAAASALRTPPMILLRERR